MVGVEGKLYCLPQIHTKFGVGPLVASYNFSPT